MSQRGVSAPPDGPGERSVYPIILLPLLSTRSRERKGNIEKAGFVATNRRKKGGRGRRELFFPIFFSTALEKGGGGEGGD